LYSISYSDTLLHRSIRRKPEGPRKKSSAKSQIARVAGDPSYLFELVPFSCRLPDSVRRTGNIVSSQRSGLGDALSSSRQTATYRHGNFFLAGDAAHIHSPVGGQGMNTGIQDVWNLGCKIALVARDLAHERLHDTYDAERWPVGKIPAQIHRQAVQH
jgi:FAD binding domain